MVAQGSGLPADLVLAINWNSGTGVGATAFLDQNKTRPLYDYSGGGSQYFEVRSSAADGRGWAPPNYLRMTPLDTPHIDGFEEIGFDLANGAYIPSFAVGDGLLLRYYIRNVYPFVSLDTTTHGDEFQAAGGSGGTCGSTDIYGTTYEYAAGSSWRPVLYGLPLGNYGPGVGFGQSPFVLSLGTEYRFQFGFRRESTTTVQAFAQIYAGTPGGVLLHDHTDFDRQGWDNQPTRNIINDGPFTEGSDWWTCGLREWWMGLNGISGLTTANDGEICFEWAGLAMRFGQNIDFNAAWEFDAAELTWSP